MDVVDLKVFEAVARLGSMSRAATELNTVQSAVTGRVRQVEDRLGTSLFHRHSRGVGLTDAGTRLLPYARRVLSLIEEAQRAALDDGRPRGPLTIGSLETTAAIRLSPILASFAQAHSEVDLALVTGTTDELIRRVLASELEGAFVSGPVDHPELATEVMVEEELVLLSAPHIESIEALRAERGLKIVVLRAGCSYRQRLEALLAAQGVVGLRCLEFGTIDGIVGCVAAGIGISLLPRAVVADPVRGGRIRTHTPSAGASRAQTLFIRRVDGYRSSALEAFLRQVREGLPPKEPAAADGATPFPADPANPSSERTMASITNQHFPR